MKQVAYEKEELQKLCAESFSYNEVLTKAGKAKGGKNNATLHKYIDLYGIDVSHFTSSTSPTKGKEKVEKILPATKICKQCGIEKDTFEDYYWSNGKTRTICKDCVKENERKRYNSIRENIIEFKKTLCCKKCGENRYYLLDFHHRNPEEKDYAISEKTHNNIESLKNEIDKCDVLCANCHREWHFLYPQGTSEEYQKWIEK